MKKTREVRFGRVCLKHPQLNGERYLGNNVCVQCGQEYSKFRHAERNMTVAQEITALRAENFRLKQENESLRLQLGVSENEVAL